MDRRPAKLRNSLRLIALGFCLSLTAVVRSFALDPSREIHQYNCQTWTYQDGLEAGAINAIAQSQDGYLWLGTSRGLVRFDGINFVPMGAVNSPKLSTAPILCLVPSGPGGFWLGTQWSGFGYYDGRGRFTPGKSGGGDLGWKVPCILVRPDGQVWLGGDAHCISSGARNPLKPILPALPSEFISAMLAGSRGRLWVGTGSDGLFCLADGKVTRPADNSLNRSSITALAEDAQGRLWVGTPNGPVCYDAGGKPVAIAGPQYQVNVLLADSEGAVWMGTAGGGLWRYDNGQWNQLQKTDGLANDFVLALAEDREGSIWIGTRNGLSQLTDVKLPIFSRDQGLPDESAISVSASPRGGLWVSTARGAAYFNGRAFTTLCDTNSGLPSAYVKRALEARNGDLYVVQGGNQVDVLSHGRLVATHRTPAMAVALTEDARSVIVSAGGNLFRVGRDFLKPYSFTDGVRPELYWVLNLATAPDGSVLVAGVNGVCRIAGGSFEQWTSKDGLPASGARWVLETRDGTIWAGLTSGIARIRGRQVRIIRQADGLPDDRICAIVPDASGNFWVNSEGGIFRVSRQSLNDFADGKTHRVACVAYNNPSAVKVDDQTDQEQSGCRTADGRIWFPGSAGAVMIDPAHLTTNALPPPVYVDGLYVNGRKSAVTNNLAVPPGRGEIQFQYTALSYIDPWDIRFRYKLEGYDSEWVNAGSRRLAVYNNLLPGRYTFRVIARNADGVWNKTGDALRIQLLPHYYQTAWFDVLCVVAGLLALGGIYTWRVGALKRREARLAARVQERTAELSTANAALNEQIHCRERAQAELEHQKARLEKEIEERKRMQDEIEKTHSQLVVASRQAGQAEVASSVLHNVGNVLNSANVSASIVADRLRRMQFANLSKAAQLIQEHAPELGPFFTEHEKGRQLPQYLQKLARYLDGEQRALLAEVNDLGLNLEHIKEIVAMQQTYAKAAGVAEKTELPALVESALKMNAGAYQRHAIDIVRDYQPVPDVTLDRHKVLQILINLFANAKYACDEGPVPDKKVVIRIRPADAGRVRVEIADNGVGIPAQNLTRIFSHGFTTRKNGHGFGLHSSALAAREMGGTLLARSEGAGRGATFILELPLRPVESNPPGHASA